MYNHVKKKVLTDLSIFLPFLIKIIFFKFHFITTNH